MFSSLDINGKVSLPEEYINEFRYRSSSKMLSLFLVRHDTLEYLHVFHLHFEWSLLINSLVGMLPSYCFLFRLLQYSNEVDFKMPLLKILKIVSRDRTPVID